MHMGKATQWVDLNQSQLNAQLGGQLSIVDLWDSSDRRCPWEGPWGQAN